MKLILLAGNSIKNKEWIEDVKTELEDFFDSTEILYYNHWSTSAPFISYPTELKALRKLAVGDYMIFAKSAGIGLTLRAFDAGWLKPKKCVFVGVPYGPVDSEGAKWLKKMLNNFKISTLVIQEVDDPYGKFAIIKNIVTSNNYQLAEVIGNEHKYADIAKLKKLILDFVKL